MSNLKNRIVTALTDARDCADWIMFFESQPLTRLRALHRVAKQIGAYPFFKHPKLMMLLRQILERRNDGNTKSLLLFNKIPVDNSL